MSCDKRDFLFRFVPQPLRTKLKLDDEAQYSTTDQVTAKKICDELCKFVPTSATVIDATACIGGLTYTMANVFHRVVAIEQDPVKFSYLEHNMDILNVAGAVQCLQGDALDVAKAQAATAIIIDPPWGGPQYKHMPFLRLMLGNMDVASACDLLFINNPCVVYIAVKVPINFDEERFVGMIVSHQHSLIHRVRLRKMCLLIVKRKNEI